MKIQSLAVIFAIIIVPISIVLSEFMQIQIKNISLQTSYNSALVSATYDAMKAYQINSINNGSNNDIANSKMRDIESSANTFLNSIKSNFKYSGNNSKIINDYVPAIVFTMYDGYYIYSPYNNDIRDIYNNNDLSYDWASYRDGEVINGIKPYIYYSCRYVGNSCDVIITYSLDNYITIQGKVGSEYWNKSGYYLDKIEKSGNTYYYNGALINSNEGTLRESIYDVETENVENYDYVKINGTKYYKDSNDQIFYIQNGEKLKSQTDNEEDRNAYIDRITNNTSAYNFYKDAYGFTNDVKTSLLSGLSFNNAVDHQGNSININGFTEPDKIFGGSIDAEEEKSNFTTHRTAVIRYTIESNLTSAIANYDNKFGGETAFSMPNLSEEDWYKLINNTSIITFLQGIPMGTRIFNGYAIVTNNKNRDVVTDYSIYISDGEQYHRIDENGLSVANGARGFLNLDFERQTQDFVHYYYPRPEMGSYVSIINQTGTLSLDNLFDYLKDRTDLASVYYTALGRERYGMAREGKGIEEYN